MEGGLANRLGVIVSEDELVEVVVLRREADLGIAICEAVLAEDEADGIVERSGEEGADTNSSWNDEEGV